MSEPTKQQIGDGTDSYGQAFKNAMSSVRRAGRKATASAVAKGAEAAVNAAAAGVKAGVQTGKTIAGIAAGTAAGGPVGAILSSLWSLRHTVFKIIVCVCLVLLVVFVAVFSLPGIILEGIMKKTEQDPAAGVTVASIYEEINAEIAVIVRQEHEETLHRIGERIQDGGYDEPRSRAALTDLAGALPGYDGCYLLAAYSVAVQTEHPDTEQMIRLLREVGDEMFPVIFEERSETTGEGEVIRYLAATVEPFDPMIVCKAFHFGLDEPYRNTGITNREMIGHLTAALKAVIREQGGTVNG